MTMSFTSENGDLKNESLTSIKEAGNEYVSVKLDNQCGKEVKYEYKYSGGAGSGSISKNYKKQLTISVGSKLYIDGNFFMEITKAHDKQTFVVCK